MGESSQKKQASATVDNEQMKNLERANRILDAASELLQRWGYKKTTIDDIARQAGVAKGTIYLHWQTKQELFIALIVREKMSEATRIQREIEQEPDGLTLHSMAKYGVLSALRNPLIKAIMVRDIDMLGELVHGTWGQANVEQQLEAFNAYIRYLREQGLIRSDTSIEAQVHMVEAIAMGFIVTDRFLPAKYQLADEERANLAAETVKCVFEIRRPDQNERQEASAHFQHMMDMAQEFLQKETGDG